ncbi:hypothetical protein BC830DRAFT_1172069 [Chytriomyces sp. MP71]|nr:hypothetical protein BC830DRAFT_1172069 [Chytriomyces sp. MP71]
MNATNWNVLPSAPYVEYRLVSAGNGGIVAHVAKMPASAVVTSLRQPISVHRRIPELLHLEETQSFAAKPEASSADPKVDMAALAASTAKAPIDVDKIAPGSRTALHNSLANRNNPNKPYTGGRFQKKTRQMFFGAAEDGEDPTARAKKRDPDRYPWIIRDSGGEVLTGSVELDQAAQDRVLFIVDQQQSFVVTPVAKIHKFVTKPKFHTLTADEAEEKLKQKRRVERWGNTPLVAAKKTDEEIAREIDGEAANLSKEDRAELARALKRMNPAALSSSLGASSSSAGPAGRASAAATPSSRMSRGGGGGEDGLDEDIDFDEVMSDDENPDFGIENEEEAKEAKRREFGDMARRANFEGEDEKEERRFEQEMMKRKSTSKAQKKLQKALKKHNADTYVSDDDMNEYGEEEEDSEPEPEKPAAPAKPVSPALPAPKDGKSPTLAPPPPKEPSPDPEKLLKQKKKEADISGYDAVSAARKAMYSGVMDVTKARSLLNFGGVVGGKAGLNKVGSSSGAAQGGGTSPSLSDRGSASPDLAAGAGLPKFKLKVGAGGSPELSAVAGDSKKRKGADSPSLGGGGKKLKPNQSNSPNLNSSPRSGKSSTPNVGGPSKGMSAASPRLDELRGSSKKKAPSPNLEQPGGTPSLTPLISASPTVPVSGDDNILKESDIRILFTAAKPSMSVRDLVAALKDKMKFEGNKQLLTKLIKTCCRATETSKGRMLSLK